jgi:hypothetical protein
MNKLQRDEKLSNYTWGVLAVSFLGLGFLKIIQVFLGLEEQEFYRQYPAGWWAVVSLGGLFIASLLYGVKKSLDMDPNVQLRSKPDDVLLSVLRDPEYEPWHSEARTLLMKRHPDWEEKDFPQAVCPMETESGDRISFEPCHIEYDLNRRQRLLAHLKISWPSLIVALGITVILADFLTSPTRALLLLLPLWFLRGFIAGLFQILSVRVRHEDLTLDELAVGYLADDDRYHVFYDCIDRIFKSSKDCWTIDHNSGVVITIPTEVLDEKYIEHMKKWAAWGKTRAGYQFVCKRGEMVQAMMRQEKEDQDGPVPSPPSPK